MAVGKQDVSLLFGVLGEGKISGESGVLIKKQLASIVKSLNSKSEVKSRGIAVNLNAQVTKKNFKDGIKKVLTDLDGNKQFKLKITEVNAKPALKSLKKQMQDMLNTLKIDNVKAAFDKTDVPGGVQNSGSQETQKVKKDLTDINAKLKEIGVTNKKITSQYSKVSAKLTSGNDSAELAKAEKLRELYIKLETATERLQNRRDEATQDEIQNIYKLQQELREMLGLYSKAEKSDAQLAKEASTIQSRFSSVQRAAQTALGYTAAKHTEQYKAIQLANTELDAMALNITDIDPVRFEELNSIIKKNTSEIKSMGLATKSWTDTLLKGAEKFTRWFSMSQIIMAAVHGARQMLDIVKDIDAAMTELKKVTDETDAAYTRFLDNAATRAKRLGATLSDTVNATADFARLGYSINEASALADAALVYKNVGDGIEDIGTACLY